MGNVTFMGIFCLLKIKLTHKPSLATNSCLLFEPQSSFTGVPFVLLEFSGKLDVRDWKSTGLFWFISPARPSPNPSFQRVCLTGTQILPTVTNDTHHVI